MQVIIHGNLIVSDGSQEMVFPMRMFEFGGDWFIIPLGIARRYNIKDLNWYTYTVVTGGETFTSTKDLHNYLTNNKEVM